MTAELRLVVFDVDGTLVDSQADILEAMAEAFQAAGLPAPTRKSVLGIVGLSLNEAMRQIAPKRDAAVYDRLVDAYKTTYHALRLSKGASTSSPLYAGARETLEALHKQPETLLGLATGKSRRGLDAMLAAHALDSFFVTRQVADFHPSKPHPSMLQAALAESTVPARRAAMVGDTSFDMEMAKAAGLFAIGVTWGYHRVEQLNAADKVVESFAELQAVLKAHWG